MAPLSRVKHSTTEPLCSHRFLMDVILSNIDATAACRGIRVSVPIPTYRSRLTKKLSIKSRLLFEHMLWVIGPVKQIFLA